MTITALVFVLFLALKLTGVIAWSWWWVTAPLWGGALLYFIFVGVILFARHVLKKGWDA